MRKSISFIMAFLFMLLPCYAFDTILESNAKETIVYPTTTQVSLDVSFQKALLDNIEDLKYSINITGPAEIQYSGKSIGGTIEKFNESRNLSFILDLEDTSSADIEYITIVVSGDYVSNSIILGGKKQFRKELTLSIVSTERNGMANDEKQSLQAQISTLTAESVKCKSDFAACQTGVASLRAENELLKNEVNALKSANAQLQSKEAAAAKKNSPIVIISLILIIIVLALVIAGMIFTKKNSQQV